MNTKIRLAVLDKISTPVFFLFLFLYQFVFALQSVDFLDEGFSATFYQQFYNDPISVNYNFMFWLTGLVGGTFYKLFPDSGLLGFRVLAIICTVSTAAVVYSLLKRYINRRHLMIGLALVTMCLCQNPKIFHYNFLSILLYATTISLLFRGLKNNSYLPIFAAGACVGLDVFARIPSIVNLGLVIAIGYHGFIYKLNIRRIIWNGLSFIVGFCVSVAMVLLIMHLVGHLEIFLKAVKMVTQMSHSDEESGYSLWKLITQFIRSYNDAFLYTAYILALFFVAAIAPAYGKERYHISNNTALIIKWVAILASVLIMIKGMEILIRFYVGLTIISFVAIFLSKSTREIKLLMLMGTYIVMTYALGSSSGIFTAGIHIFWVGFPIAVDFILNLGNFGSQMLITTRGDTGKSSEAIRVSEPQFKRIKKYIICIAIVGCIYHQWKYPLHDETNRFNMHYAIDNKYLRGLRTSKPRADATNELLRESAKYIKPNDYVMAFHSFPIFNYITNTRPFAGNSMPWYYTSSAFKEHLYEYLEITKSLPILVIQKIKTTPNDQSDWPDQWPTDPIFHQPESDVRTIKETEYLNEFMDKYNYQLAWENSLFKIMLPPK